MNQLDKEIYNIIKKGGGKNIPYSEICKELNDLYGIDNKKVRGAIRKYKQGTGEYKQGNPNLYLIELISGSAREKCVSINQHYNDAIL